jgi:hypothetical protein
MTPLLNRAVSGRNRRYDRNGRCQGSVSFGYYDTTRSANVNRRRNAGNERRHTIRLTTCSGTAPLGG